MGRIILLNNMRRILLLVWLSMATFMGVLAQNSGGVSVSGTNWELSEDGVLSISGNGEMDEGLSYEWRSYRDYVKELVVNEGVTTICYMAFEGMKNLTKVSLPQSLEYIEDNVFSGCTSLPVVDNVRYAGDYLVEVVDKSVTTCKIKEGTRYIGASSFEVCTALTEIALPESIVFIGRYAFAGCSSLTFISFPKNLRHIDEDAFTDAKIYVGTATQSAYEHFRGPMFRTIVSLNAVAPSPYEKGYDDFDDQVFSHYTYNHAPLYVPEGSYWNYAYGYGWGEFIHIKEMAMDESALQSRQAYMIADAKGCNYTVYDADKGELVNVEYTHSLDEESEGSCWTVLKYGGKSFLYNIGAKKFASMDKDGKLTLSDAPVNMNITATENGLSINGKSCMFVLNKNINVDATGIENVLSGTESAEKSEVYTIDGRRMDKAVHGINIVNGNKVLVK